MKRPRPPGRGCEAARNQQNDSYERGLTIPGPVPLMLKVAVVCIRSFWHTKMFDPLPMINTPPLLMVTVPYVNAAKLQRSMSLKYVSLTRRFHLEAAAEFP